MEFAYNRTSPEITTPHGITPAFIIAFFRIVSFASIVISSKSIGNSLHEYPILIAVSILSPVIIQINIPACYNIKIVFSTSSYNLSSIAVAPTKVSSYSISF